MNLMSHLLTIKLAKVARGESNRVERVTAEGQVAIDFVAKAFDPRDITNLTGLAARLQQPAAEDAVGQFAGSQLTAVTRGLLANYEGGTNAALRVALAEELNRLTQSGWIYETNRFAKVKLSPDTAAALGQHPMGIDLVELNRLLLLDAFRGEIARTERGEKTHATGERAVYENKGSSGMTNAVLELSGHPKLEKPDGWVTAEETIIYDRTTGKSHFVGKPHFQMKFGGVTGVTAPGAETKKKK